MNHTSDDLYKFLEKLKELTVISVRELSKEEIFFADSLVNMGLASKASTRVTTFYFYGVSDGTN